VPASCGTTPKAIACCRRASELSYLIGDRYHHADTLAHVGDARRLAAGLPSARRAWHDALVILDDLRHPDGEDMRRKLAGANEE
jgi:hypothetical protein